MKTLIESNDDLRSQLASDSDGSLAHQLAFDLCSAASCWRAQAATAFAPAEQVCASAISSAFGHAAHIVEALAPQLRER